MKTWIDDSAIILRKEPFITYQSYISPCKIPFSILLIYVCEMMQRQMWKNKCRFWEKFVYRLWREELSRRRESGMY